jgi:toxin ParE1/3/4
MPRIAIRPQAELDILEIWEFIAADNVDAADHWVDELGEKLELWAAQPMIGRMRDELAPGIRSLPFGRYLIFCMPMADGIDVVRVLHASRDIDNSFSP